MHSAQCLKKQIMNQIEFPGPNGGSQRGTNVKSSSFTIENLLKPEKKRSGSECPVETPSKIKALSVAAHLAGLHFSLSPTVLSTARVCVELL